MAARIDLETQAPGIPYTFAVLIYHSPFPAGVREPVDNAGRIQEIFWILNAFSSRPEIG
jgi:hypothetical protein